MQLVSTAAVGLKQLVTHIVRNVQPPEGAVVSLKGCNFQNPFSLEKRQESSPPPVGIFQTFLPFRGPFLRAPTDFSSKI